MQEPDGGIASVHSGILASAAALNHDLEDHGILSALLTGAAVDRKARQQHTAAKLPPVNDAVIAAFAASPEAAAFIDLNSLAMLQGAPHPPPPVTPPPPPHTHTISYATELCLPSRLLIHMVLWMSACAIEMRFCVRFLLHFTFQILSLSKSHHRSLQLAILIFGVRGQPSKNDMP